MFNWNCYRIGRDNFSFFLKYYDNYFRSSCFLNQLYSTLLNFFSISIIFNFLIF